MLVVSAAEASTSTTVLFGIIECLSVIASKIIMREDTGDAGRERSSGVRFLASHLLRSPRPLPQPVGNVTRESMTELTRQHHDLTSVMGLVCDEICQDVWDVQRQVAPDVALRRRHVAARSDTELEEVFDPPVAPLKSGKQFTPGYGAAVHRVGDRDPMFLAECPEPHATNVVQMPSDHADRAPRCPGDGGLPEDSGEVLHQVRRDPTIGPPGGQKRRSRIVLQQPLPFVLASATAHRFHDHHHVVVGAAPSFYGLMTK
jgi:hypothetical protein